MKLNESIKRKLSIAIVVVMMVSFMFAKTVSAKTFLEEAGGKLMKPVLTLGLQRVSLDVLTMIIPINILLLVTYAMTVLLVSSEKTVGDCSVRFL